MDSGVTIERLRDAARALKFGDSRMKLRAIQAAQDALDAAKAEELVALEESKDYELDGASSVTTWARNELRLDAKATKALVRAAATMRDLPAVGAAAAEGRVRLDHLAVFGYGLKHIGAEVVGQCEDWLLDVAVKHEPAGLRQVMRDLREAVYPDKLDQAWIDGMDRQDIQVNPVPDGWHVNGFLGSAAGAKFRQVLDTLGAPRDADDRRPGSERRVEAFDRMLTQVLESGLPSDKGIRPQLSIIVDTHGPSARLAGFGSIGPKLLDYLSCLSDLTPIVTDGGDAQQAKILNVGRTRRHANRQQRRAIITRQGGECAAPGWPTPPQVGRSLTAGQRRSRDRARRRSAPRPPPPRPPRTPQHPGSPRRIRLHHPTRTPHRTPTPTTHQLPAIKRSPTNQPARTATDLSNVPSPNLSTLTPESPPAEQPRVDADHVDSLAHRLLSQPPLEPGRERMLARAARAGDRGARDDLVRESLRLVALRALHLGLRNDALDEAMQSGTLGLIAAVDRFDPDRGSRLATYAWPWITAAIRTTMRVDVPNSTWGAIDSATVVDPPDDLRPELEYLPPGPAAVIRLRYRLGELAGPPRTRKEVATRLGLTVAQVRADEARAMTHLRARLAKVGHRAPRSSTDAGADPL